MFRRLGEGVRAFFTPRGLVGALLGGGFWAITSAALAQFAEFRLGPALAMGGGFGLLGVAGFIWWVVIPRREAASARIPQLKALLRRYHDIGQHLMLLASPPTSEADIAAKMTWRSNLEAVLTDTVGKHRMRPVLRGSISPAQLQKLASLADQLDKVPLRHFDMDHLPEPPSWSR